MSFSSLVSVKNIVQITAAGAALSLSACSITSPKNLSSGNEISGATTSQTNGEALANSAAARGNIETYHTTTVSFSSVTADCVGSQQKNNTKFAFASLTEPTAFEPNGREFSNIVLAQGIEHLPLSEIKPGKLYIIEYLADREASETFGPVASVLRPMTK